MCKKRDFGPYSFLGNSYLTKAELNKAKSQQNQIHRWKSKQVEPKYTEFQKWLINFIEEKQIDMSEPMRAGDGTTLAAGDVLSSIMSAPEKEQKEIQKTFVLIDFKNGDIMHYISHLAGALTEKDKVCL